MLQLTNSFNAKHIHIYPPKFHQNVLNQNMFSEFLKAGNPTSQDLHHWDPTTSPGVGCLWMILVPICAHLFEIKSATFPRPCTGYWSSWARFEMRTCPGENCTGSHFAWLAESHGFGNRNYPCFLYVQARLWVSTSRFNFVLLLY